MHRRNCRICRTSTTHVHAEIDHDPEFLMWTADKQPEDVKIIREMMEEYNPYNSELTSYLY